MMRIIELQHKNVAIFGLGREGRSVYRAIRRILPEQPLTLLNDTPLSDGGQLETDPHAKLCAGPRARQRLAEFDVIIKSPGISPYTAEFAAARAGGTHITSATRLWFAEHPHARTVCITGTKGKSTTAALLAHLLKQRDIPTVLAGNIGIPLWDCEMPPAAAQPPVWVIELSSYQTCDLDIQPHLSVLLNLFPEHTDWHGDTHTYFRDKLNLLEQTGARPKIVNRRDARTLAYLPDLPGYRFFNCPDGFHCRNGEIWHNHRRLLVAGALPLPGPHNLANLCAVFTALEALEIEAASCVEHLATFQGLPHRLQLLGEKNRLRYVDDSISTTPQSVIAALEAFAGETVTLLVGGYERNLDWRELALYLKKHPLHALIGMGVNGPRILQTLQAETTGLSLHQVEHLNEAVALAADITPPGGVVLLSPGSPSYGQFRDFQERGAVFAAAAGF